MEHELSLSLGLPFIHTNIKSYYSRVTAKEAPNIFLGLKTSCICFHNRVLEVKESPVGIGIYKPSDPRQHAAAVRKLLPAGLEWGNLGSLQVLRI